MVTYSLRFKLGDYHFLVKFLKRARVAPPWELWRYNAVSVCLWQRPREETWGQGKGEKRLGRDLLGRSGLLVTRIERGRTSKGEETQWHELRSTTCGVWLCVYQMAMHAANHWTRLFSCMEFLGLERWVCFWSCMLYWDGILTDCCSVDAGCYRSA
jgi:hypothetical protein